MSTWVSFTPALMTMHTLTKRVLRRVIRQADQVKQNLVWLLGGLASCFFGLLLIVTAEFLFQQSLTQEIIAFTGVVLIAVGLLFAAAGFISLSLLRLIRFLQEDSQR